MKLQCSPNNWSCTPTALAMALDVPVEEIVRLAGHDGAGMPWPEPFHIFRAGFHIHEMIDVAYMYFRRPLCPFVRDPKVTPDANCPEQPAVCRTAETLEQRWLCRLYNQTGIMTGQMMDTGMGHCVAWDGHRIYDPRGYVYLYTDRQAYKYEPDTFWLVGDYNGSPSKIVS